MSESTWRSIETAPRNGAAIIVGREHYTSQAVRWMISVDKGAPDGAWFVGGYNGTRLQWQPTHWTELPRFTLAPFSPDRGKPHFPDGFENELPLTPVRVAPGEYEIKSRDGRTLWRMDGAALADWVCASVNGYDGAMRALRTVEGNN